MGTLCARLKDFSEAGTYRLNCSLPELRAAVEAADYELFEADLAEVQGKGGFLAAVASAVAAPDWFGHNFDALADALGDLSWRPAPGYVLLLCNGGESLGLGESDHAVVLKILSETAAFWKSHGKPFWVFFI